MCRLRRSVRRCCLALAIPFIFIVIIINVMIIMMMMIIIIITNRRRLRPGVRGGPQEARREHRVLRRGGRGRLRHGRPYAIDCTTVSLSFRLTVFSTMQCTSSGFEFKQTCLQR